MKYAAAELKNIIDRFLEVSSISSLTVEDKLDPVFREVEQERIRRNFVNIIPSSLMLLIIEMLGVFYNLVTGTTRKYQLIYQISFIVFFIFTVIILKYIDTLLKNNSAGDKKKEYICYIYWVIYTLSALCFSVFEVLDSGTLIHFSVLIFFLTLWPVLEPHILIAYYSFIIIVQTGIMYVNSLHYLCFVLCYIFTVIGIILSFIKYTLFMSRHIDIKKFERMSELDPLTNILNRRGMKRSVDGIWSYCESHSIPITIAMLDIDFFKMYNDKFGHSKGDECIQEIANCIKKNFPRKTDITCRFGGEEFIIIVAGEPEEKALLHFKKLQNEIESLKMESGCPDFNKYVTVSCGVFSSYIENGLSFDDSVLKADEELYNAKKNGRKCISCNSEIYNRD